MLLIFGCVFIVRQIRKNHCYWIVDLTQTDSAQTFGLRVSMQEVYAVQEVQDDCGDLQLIDKLALVVDILKSLALVVE